MFGKLGLDSLPLDEPIPIVASLIVATVILGVLAWTWRAGHFPYLWREWITSVDHKRVGVMYCLLAGVMLLRGFSDALLMRSQQAIAMGNPGYLPSDHYDQVFSAHGTIMIFFVAMPFMIGLMNFAVPLQLGVRDVAFPTLNSVSFWLTASGALLINISLFIGEFAKTGWVVYPPLSELRFSPGVGVDYYLWATQISGVGTLLSGVNLVTTILKMRAPGMGYTRMPMFCWTSLATNLLIVAAFPILTATLAMLTLDRYLGFHFFTSEAGGNAMMFVNLIWAWGHPEVYILILPAFGIFSEVVSTFSGKPLFGYRSMILATMVICLLSFTVWLHHFFTMGAGADVNGFFGVTTMIIAVPTGVKVFNWLFTMYGGRIRFTTPMLWAIGFICTFVIGGMSGVLLAVPPADFVLHNSLFLVAHFHNVIIGGVLFGAFAGWTYWFPKMFGFRLHEGWGKAAFWLWLTGFYLAFMPLYVLGLMGMTRRLARYDVPEWQPWLIAAACGAVLIAAGIGCQIIQLYVSIRDREALRDESGDPWDGRTLEWITASPPPAFNFAVLPNVDGEEAYWGLKARARETQQLSERPDYEAIEMPRNSPTGVVCAFFASLMGFALVWHIWWLVIAGLFGAWATFVIFAWRDHGEYEIGPDEARDRDSARREAKAKLLDLPPGSAYVSAAVARQGSGSDPHKLGHEGRPVSEQGPAPKRIVVSYGFWIFLLSDFIMFSGFFAAYAVLASQTAGGPAGRDLFDLPLVAAETVLLLLSSFACGMAGIAASVRNTFWFQVAMAITAVLGTGFLGIELYEFAHLIGEGAGPDRSAFLSSFFALVGCHGLHVALGLLWLSTMMAQVWAKGFRDDILRRITCFALFWHALDIIWVALFTTVYLLGSGA